MKHLLWILFLPLSALAQTAALTEQLGRTVVYQDVAIAPDATHLAWAQTTSAQLPTATLYLSPTSGDAHPVDIPGATKRMDKEPAWSPDSKTLAFFSNGAEPDQVQLWTVGARGGTATRRTKLKGFAARPRWSHDGTRIAFLYIEGAGGGGPLLAAPPATGVIDTDIHNQRVVVLDVGTGALKQISPADLHIYDYDWSPNDRQFVVTAAPGPGDNNWWIAQLYTIDVATGQATSIYKPSLQIAIPRWSPDGKSLAFIEGLMSDEGFHGGDLFTLELRADAASSSKRAPVNRTAERKSSVSSLFWLQPDRILMTEVIGGESAVSELSARDGAIHVLWKGGEDVHAFGNFPNFALAREGTLSAVVRSSFESAPEVWFGAVGDWRPVTHGNEGQVPAWGKVHNLEWPNEGFTVQGWLLAPKHVQEGRRSPMIVLIHGGPSGVARPGWPAEFGALVVVLASQGYYVLMPNPRGSYGQGETFTRANVKDFGGGDLRDILAGVDVAVARFAIDPERLGVTGWSYGGYMTMWTVTQTQRFKAAMAGAGLANWQSYYGENLIDQWMIPFFGASVYDDPQVYAKSSPITFIKNVKTPTLIQVGEYDAECPAPQSYEFWHALHTLHVPTQLVVYAGEGHMFVTPSNRTAMQDRTVAWFDKYLK